MAVLEGYKIVCHPDNEEAAKAVAESQGLEYEVNRYCPPDSIYFLNTDLIEHAPCLTFWG